MKPANKCKIHNRSESGQALVEYILMIVVVIMIATIVADRLFRPMQKWANFFIGDYVECLLDQGELPALGGSSEIKDCDPQDYFADGKNSGSSGGDKGSGAEKGSSAGSAKNKTGNKDADSSSGGAGTLRSTNGGRSFSVGRSTGMDGNRSGSDAGINVGDAGEKGSEKASYFRALSGNGSGNRINLGSGSRAYGLAGLLEAEREKIKRREEKVQKVLSSGDESAAARQAKRTSVNENLRRSADKDITFEGFSFGKIFRFGLILIIVIALVMFIAGQMAQLSKGLEK